MHPLKKIHPRYTPLQTRASTNPRGTHTPFQVKSKNVDFSTSSECLQFPAYFNQKEFVDSSQFTEVYPHRIWRVPEACLEVPVTCLGVAYNMFKEVPRNVFLGVRNV